MKDLAKFLATPAIQERVRQAMRHSETYRVAQDMPDFLTEKLAELDRVTADGEGKAER